MNVENPIILGSSLLLASTTVKPVVVVAFVDCIAVQVVSCGAIWSNSHMKVNTRIHTFCPA